MADRKIQVIYLTDAIGSKRNGGSALSGLRMLELLVARYGYVDVVTNDVRNSIVGSRHYKVTKVKRDPPPLGLSFRALARFVGIRVLNLGRPKVVTVDARGASVLLVVNSFTTLLDRVKLRNAKHVFTVCVVRGDTNSFEFQAFDEGKNADRLKAPIAFLDRFDGLIFVSQTTKRNWETVLTRSQRRYLLPNAIDEREVGDLLTTPVDNVKAALGWSADEFHIVVVGSIQTRKGQDIFAAAAAELIRIIPNARVHFVGVVSPLWGGTEIAESLRASGRDRYVLHGHRDDALRLVRAADVAVMVSRSEAFPRTVAEYMALGKPIVSTPVAGADEMVIDGQTGLLIPIADPSALVQSLTTLHQDLERRAQLGDAARKRYLNEYSMSSQAQRFSEIFNDIDSILLRPDSSPQTSPLSLEPARIKSAAKEANLH